MIPSAAARRSITSAPPGVPNVVLTSHFDPVGNRTALSATIDGIADFENTYAYDALSQMTSVEQSGVGILPATDKRVDFSYNALGQFTSINRYEDLTASDLVASSIYAYVTAGRLDARQLIILYLPSQAFGKLRA